MNVLPILAIGGAIYFLSKKKEDATKLKALPAAKDLGTVFGRGGQELPDIITAKVGERFSIALDESAGTGYSWILAATPPDDVLVAVDPKTVPGCTPKNKYCYIEVENTEGKGGWSGRRFFIFEAKEPGDGSVVLHLMPPGAQAPPAEVIDIKVQITGA